MNWKSEDLSELRSMLSFGEEIYEDLADIKGLSQIA